MPLATMYDAARPFRDEDYCRRYFIIAVGRYIELIIIEDLRDRLLTISMPRPTLRHIFSLIQMRHYIIDDSHYYCIIFSLPQLTLLFIIHYRHYETFHYAMMMTLHYILRLIDDIILT